MKKTVTSYYSRVTGVCFSARCVRCVDVFWDGVNFYEKGHLCNTLVVDAALFTAAIGGHLDAKVLRTVVAGHTRRSHAVVDLPARSSL